MVLALPTWSCIARSDPHVTRRVGDDCIENAECPEACIGGICHDFASGGELCDELGDCLPGFVCGIGFCAEADVCGNGVPELGEVCDDGNTVTETVCEYGTASCTLCNADCTSERSLTGNVCGDSDPDPVHEACDDGPGQGEGLCINDCSAVQTCGDAVAGGTEACDDGKNGDDCDGCHDDCTTGCICATGQGCAPTGQWCNAGACEPCDVHEHCGSACEDCTLLLLVCRPDGTACELPTDCTGQADFTACNLDTSPTDRWYDICVSQVCVSPGCGDATCNVPGPNFDLADTNQRDCYNGTGVMASCPGTAGAPNCGSTAYCGQDAQYGWDTQNSETARFTRTESVLGEPVVTDNVTGLMWQGCSRGQSGGDCLTGAATTSDWSTALSDCNGLSWAGDADWRLPDRFELHSIVDVSLFNIAIDLQAFPATPSSYFWSSSSYAINPAYGWDVGFHDGDVNAHVKTMLYHARCVRRAP